MSWIPPVSAPMSPDPDGPGSGEVGEEGPPAPPDEPGGDGEDGPVGPVTCAPPPGPSMLQAAAAQIHTHSRNPRRTGARIATLRDGRVQRRCRRGSRGIAGA